MSFYSVNDDNPLIYWKQLYRLYTKQTGIRSILFEVIYSDELISFSIVATVITFVIALVALNVVMFLRYGIRGEEVIKEEVKPMVTSWESMEKLNKPDAKSAENASIARSGDKLEGLEAKGGANKPQKSAEDSKTKTAK
ncbi:unnamed protein product [Toxocara canis]|uniref:Ion_trans domain-containing protein n=1 Tax=Toxocara canis TaxID=6265 RepID=A0A183UV20_TOXCA|nr:unnamed protein product [Toxocara canis]